MSLTSYEKERIVADGFSPSEIEKQLQLFKNNNYHLELLDACKVANGIIQINNSEHDSYIKSFTSSKHRFSKFVPASGAASRMFKTLNAFLSGNINDHLAFVEDFVLSLHDFPFYSELQEACRKNNEELNELIAKKDYEKILLTLLSEDGLNYSTIAKGRIAFHSIRGVPRNAIEEQLRESTELVDSVHFTVPESQMAEFKAIAKSCLDKENLDIKLSFSVQNGKTNTIAVNPDNSLFEDNGKYLYRPAGHGALIGNLNNLSADIVFIKNIDNLQADQSQSILYKKLLGGYYLQTEKKIHNILNALKSNTLGEAAANSAKEFAIELFACSESDLLTQKDLFNFFNRPLRICGMVKNIGEAGGGPFWAKNSKGLRSAQIVEGSQVDLERTDQVKCLKSASHFNPVDLLCGLKDFEGNSFNLENFVDHSAVFISEKSHKGKPLKALELPGLWNGAMADWLTLFVEVPLSTFSPVKTVMDLLKPAHKIS